MAPAAAQAPAATKITSSSGGRKGTGKGSQEGTSTATAMNSAKPRRGWGSPAVATSAGIAQLGAMGFGADEARQALAEHAWDVNKALDSLLMRTHSPWGALNSDMAANLADAAQSNADAIVTSPSSKATCSAGDADCDADAAFGAQDTALGNTTSGTFSDASDVSDASEPEPSQPSARWHDLDKRKVDVDVAATPTTTCSEATPAKGLTPRKELLKVIEDYCPEECSVGQLAVRRGSFVRVWRDTQTGNGWIYAEHVRGESGWVPCSVVEQMASNRRWMRVTFPHTPLCEKQLTLQEDDISFVHVDTRTAEGWVFVEVHASRPELKAVDQLSSVQAGWVPDFCLEEWSGE